MTYRERITKYRDPSVERYTKVYSALNENKEVKVHNIGDQIFIRVLVDGIEVEEPVFPSEVAVRFRNYLSKLYFQCITEKMLVCLADTVAREFLPYLKDPRQRDFNDWKLEVRMGEKAY